MKCPACQQENFDGAEKCYDCGTSLLAKEASFEELSLGEPSKGEQKERGSASKQGWLYGLMALGILAIIALIIINSGGGGGGGGGAGTSGSIDTTSTANVELDVPFDVKTAAGVLTLTQAREAFSQRGFEGIELVAPFDMDGNYIDMSTIEGDSDEKYPTYAAMYLPDNADAPFIIYNSDGRFFVKTPYPPSGKPEGYIYLTELGSIVSYDDAANTYEYIIPDEDELIAVSRIDRQLLDDLKKEDLGL